MFGFLRVQIYLRLIHYISQESPVSARHQLLWRRYGFECRCVACVANWPTADNIKKSVAKTGMSGKVTTEERLRERVLPMFRICR